MSVTQTQIEQLLEALKTLLAQISSLRQQTDEIEKDLAQVQGEYDQKLGSLNAEADRLEALKTSLKNRLAQKKPAVAPEYISNSTTNKVELPPQILETQRDEPPPPLENPRSKRKRDLADHIEYFIAESDREPIMQIINAVLANEQQDVGEMLELLSWGEIWTVRAEWETLEEQYARLKSWQEALSERLTYWQNTRHRLEKTPFHGLWQEKRSRSQEDWLAFLDNLAQQQAEGNTRLAHEVEVLEQQWQAKQEVNNV
ncbi:MAG: hypothetical protein F6K36_26760 [Symploca sp. SIO3C6]|nr:hypothetical protein [Symploca sp. SIO3C6]